jgi:hypothetical protein
MEEVFCSKLNLGPREKKTAQKKLMRNQKHLANRAPEPGRAGKGKSTGPKSLPQEMEAGAENEQAGKGE